MYAHERNRARQLRIKGWSVRSIAQKLGRPRSSISLWVRDIRLSPEQIEELKSNQDRGRAKAANHPNSPKLKWQGIRQQVIDEAASEIPTRYSLQDLKFIGTALYWAEGYKQGRSLFVFANSDPAMIKLMMEFLFKICKVSKDKFCGRVNIYPSLNVKEAERYWSKVSGIPVARFYKPLLSVSKASLQKRKTLPYGTFRIIISDVVLCSHMHGWISGLKNLGK